MYIQVHSDICTELGVQVQPPGAEIDPGQLHCGQRPDQEVDRQLQDPRHCHERHGHHAVRGLRGARPRHPQVVSGVRIISGDSSVI